MLLSNLADFSKENKVISFYLTTGELVEALAVKQEEDGVVFIFADTLDDERPMHSDITEDIDYKNTNLSYWLNLELIRQFPIEIIEKMLPFENGDFLRLPTEREIFGENLWGEHEDKNIQQWECMKNDLIRSCDDWYWLQTKTINPPKEYCCVASSGNSCFLRHYLLNGVRPVFKLIYESEKTDSSPTKIETTPQKETDGENVSDPSKNKEIKMELTWLNCWECPPEKVVMDGLTATNGKDIYDAFWYRPNGWMIRVANDWIDVNNDQKHLWWADLRRTISEMEGSFDRDC